MSKEDLKENFSSFVKKNSSISKFDDFKFKALKVLLQNKKAVEIGTEVTSTLKDFVIKRNAFTLVNGAFNVLSTLYLSSIYYPEDYFNMKNGWELLTIDKNNVAKLFENNVNIFPYTVLSFKQTHVNCKIYQLPIGVEVALMKDCYCSCLYFRPSEISKDALFEYLVKEKIKQLNSNYFSLCYSKSSQYGSYEFDLIPEINNGLLSPKSKHFCDYVKKFNDASINRSLLFYGPPGTGKTTLSQAIVKGLGYNTLKIRLDRREPLEVYKFLIEKFNVEAVIIDDFDQVSSSQEYLELFEMFNRNAKLTIALANSLKQFHSAILRPGRFDEIIIVDSVEDDSIKEVLKEIYADYGAKVKNWPVAYMKELYYKSKFSSPKELEETFEDLQKRIDLQLADLKK